MKYFIKNVELINYETVELSLETDSDSGKVDCKLIVPRDQYEKFKLNIGSYFELQIRCV